MKKPLIGILFGAAVVFVWGMVSWMVLPWHAKTMKTLPEEQLITDTLKTVVTQSGFYAFPSCPMVDGKKDMNAWAEKNRKGPNGFLVFVPGGREPMTASNFVVGIVGDLFIALITMIMLSLSRLGVRTVLGRAFFVAGAGCLVALAVHLPYWNWMSFPADFTLVSMADSVIAFFLLGLTQAKFVVEG